jgi:plastocyanin
VLIDWGFASSYPLSVLAPGMLPVFEKTDGMESRPLATLVPASTAALAPGTPGPSLEPPGALLPLDDLRAIPAVPTRDLDFQNALSINGKRFKEGRIDQTVELGGIEEWNVRNTSDENRGWHPFHIHVNDFQVLSISEEQLEPVWFTDTVPLPTGGDVVMRMLFPDFTGRFVYHCHFLRHEDSGMMGVIDVAAPVRISGSTLVPDRASVSVGPTVPPLPNNGTTVVWTNLEHDACIIVAEDTDLLTNQPLFSSAVLEHGASFAHTFDAPGTFTYRCASTDGAGITGAVMVAAEQTVEILESGFHPAEVVVAVGTTVAWTNRNPSAHTATADALDASGAPRFDTGRLGPLTVGRYTFVEAGDFSYHSELNPEELKGTVKVRPVMRQNVSVGIFDDVREQPETIEVFTGSTVTWANRGRVTWRLNVDGTNSLLLDPERLFAPGQPLSPGQRFHHTFPAAGDYPFTATAPDAALTHDGTVRVVQPVEVVNYGELAFEPLAAEIRPDAEVVWINRDTVAHTVTVIGADDEPIFDSGPFGPGEQRRFPFPAAGTYTYGVTAQPGLVGTVTVQEPVR